MENYELRSSLQNAIQKWMNEVCEDDDWEDLDFYCRMTQRMSNVAFAVLISCVENQRYERLEGFFEC
jgi:hypothetical protein